MLLGLVVLLIANLIGGALSPLFVKIGTHEIPPFLFTFFRFLIATAIFLPFYLRGRQHVSVKNILKLSAFSLFFAANATLYAIGIQQTSIIASQTLYTTVPLFVGFLAHFMLGEKFSLNKIIGALISAFGVLLLVLESAKKMDTFSFGTPLGNSIILAAVICWSLYIVLSKKLSQSNSPSTTSFFSFVVTAVILMPAVPFEVAYTKFSFQNVTSIGYISLVGVGVISSALMFTLIQIGIKRTSAYIASLFSYFAPLFSAITAVPLLHEKVTPYLILAGILITSGVFVATTLGTIKFRKNKLH
ncbi:MAG: DMT family transporter [Candidatus Levybacteria bacterium]|nr:DMT family transporter [Candidatus Levybacteria bacterium]